MAAKKRSNNGAGPTQVAKTAKIAQTGRLHRVQANLGIQYQSHLSAEVMAVSIMGMFERIAYHYLIWQDRPDELQIVGQDALNSGKTEGFIFPVD